MFIVLFFLALVTAQASLQNLDLQVLQPGNTTSFYGSSPNHNFGRSVSNAGDFNGDGIDDIIIGADQTASAGTGTNPGTAYLIYGNSAGMSDINMASLTASQGLKILGPNFGDGTGWAVSKAGDVNGDGIGDIIVAAVYAPVSSTGAAYVIFGTTTPTNVLAIDATTLQSSGKGFIIQGAATNDYFGNSVGYAGDVNGDGLDDIIVGAFKADGLTTDVGKAYVIFGRNALITPITDIFISPIGFSSTLGFTIQGGPASEFVGISVDSAGDFNGDGISDIIVGAGQYGASRNDPGAAYIIFGRSGITDIVLPGGLSNTLGFKIEGVSNGDYLGFSASSAGDINDDGFDDIIIGSPNANPSLSGVAYVIFGRSGPGNDINLATTSLSINGFGFRIYGPNIQNRLGYAVKKAGDLNGDGISDIALTTLFSGLSGSTSVATAYVIYGSNTTMSDIDVSTLSSTQGFVIQNIKLTSIMILQTPISYAGDVNGDGYDDLIVGSPTNINSPLIYGSAHIIYGIPPPITVPNPPTSPTNPLQGIIDAENFGTGVGKVVAIVASLFDSASAIPLWFIFLDQILQYPKYLLIEYPYRLKLLYDKPGFQLFTIPYISDIPEEVENKITKYSIPEKFEKYDFHSSFLVNFWSSLMMLLIILLLIVIAVITDHYTKSKESLHRIFSKIKYTLKWNYIISIFTGSFCDIALYTSFEMRTVKFVDAAEWISFLLCIMINLAIIAVSIRIALIIKKDAKGKDLPAQNRRRNRRIQTLSDQLKSYAVIFEGFKDQTLKQRFYFLLFALRFYLFYTIIGYLFEHTLVQAILTNLIGMSTLLYLGFVRPFTEKLEFLVSLAQEGTLQVVHLCILLFALDDQLDFGSQGFRVVLGDITIGCNATFMGINMIYTFILVLMLLKSVYEWIRKQCKKRTTKPDNRIPLPTIRNRPKKPAQSDSERKNGMDQVNESQLVLNSPPKTEKEISNPKTNLVTRKHNSSVINLNGSKVDMSMSQIASSNPIENENENKLRFLNPRGEERKRLEMEAAENRRKHERQNRLKKRN